MGGDVQRLSRLLPMWRHWDEHAPVMGVGLGVYRCARLRWRLVWVVDLLDALVPGCWTETGPRVVGCLPSAVRLISLHSGVGVGVVGFSADCGFGGRVPCLSGGASSGLGCTHGPWGLLLCG